MIRQEQSNLNPDLGELIPIPLYPTKQDLTPKPTQDKQKCCKKYRRKVLLTSSSGESLVWTKNVTFVIDVGVERRKVSEGNQKHFARNKLCMRAFAGQGRGNCAAQVSANSFWRITCCSLLSQHSFYDTFNKQINRL